MADQKDPSHATPVSLKNRPGPDSLSVALDAVNDRWSLHVVRAVSFGAARFTDILEEVGAPRDVLTARLRTLVERGVLERKAPERGRLAGYALTQKGRDLGAVILVLKRWGDTYRDESVRGIDLRHEPCGATFVAEVTCQHCGRPVRAEDISYDRTSATEV